jgi:hypothetical protein
MTWPSPLGFAVQMISNTSPHPGNKGRAIERGTDVTKRRAVEHGPFARQKRRTPTAACSVRGASARVLPFEDSTSWNATLDLAAIRSDDGARTVLRVVNTAAAAKAARITLGGWQCAGDASVAAVELYADDLSEVNPPAQPRRVAPRAGPTVSVADDGVLAYEFRGDSFTTLEVVCAASSA